MKLSPDLKEFIELLGFRKVEYLIVGGWSFGFHATPRYTGDIDFFVRRDQQTASKLVQVIHDFGFGQLDLTKEDFLKPEFVIQLGREPNRIDILTSVTGVEFEEAWQRRVPGSLDGCKVFYISKDLLIKNKVATGRLRDLADVKELRGVDEPDVA
jgi:hypothetical protein